MGRAYGRRGAAAPPHRRVLAQHQGGDVETPGWVYQFTSETCVQWLPRFLLRAPSLPLLLELSPPALVQPPNLPCLISTQAQVSLG